jgi:hypothetical protein
MPTASAIAVMVLAVPMVMQVPWLRAMPASTLEPVLLGDVAGAQLVPVASRLSEPEPSVLPPQLPRSMGPAGTKIAGMSMLVAPSIRPGVVLSQPPISTAPSTGWLRSSSSVSIASMLR